MSEIVTKSIEGGIASSKVGNTSRNPSSHLTAFTGANLVFTEFQAQVH